LENRKEWELKGENVVKNFVVNYQTSKGLSSIAAIPDIQQTFKAKMNSSSKSLGVALDIFSFDLLESKELW
jgi:hypothetical protein